METLTALIGPDSAAITWWQMSVRGLIIFAFLVLLIRLGSLRAFGQNSAFDIVLSVILGSILSRALTGNAPLIPVLVTSAGLMFLHWLLATLAFHTDSLGPYIKGCKIQLIKDGELQGREMRRAKVTENDLREAMRSRGMTADLSRLRAAYLERDGTISVIAS